jgi:hypothetical protein
MANSTSSSSGGIGVSGLLGVVFVTLKLMGYIEWSWWLVTLPFWGGIVVFLAGFTAYFLWLVIAETIKDRKKKKAAQAKAEQSQ